MTAIERIRTVIFGMRTQAEFAAAVGVTQASVSRWESGAPMTSTQMQGIRQAAALRSIAWNDAWFFEAPISAEAAA